MSPHSDDLAQCSFLDALISDPRPTFVIDLNRANQGDGLVFCNPALENLPELHNSVKAGQLNSPSNQIQWASFTIQHQWKVVAADSLLAGVTHVRLEKSENRDYLQYAGQSSPHDSTSKAVEERLHDTRLKKPANSSTDFDTLAANAHGRINPNKRPSVDLQSPRIFASTPFAEFVRDFDWSSTELGGIETWSHQLVEACNIMLASPDACCVYYGPRAVCIYNEACIATIGDRHPRAMGARMGDLFPEVWEGHFKPLFDSIIQKRVPYVQYNDRRVGYKNGRLEEVFWNVTLVPMFTTEMEVTGTWGTLHDITTQNFWQRRIATLLRLTSSMNASNSFDTMWSAFVNGFEEGDRDVPHLLVYTAPETENLAAASQITTQYKLQFALGYDVNGGPYGTVDVTDNSLVLARLFRETLAADKPMSFQRADVHLPAEFWDAFTTSGPEDLCKTVVIIPICPVQAKDALAYLIIGLNQYVRYDKDYQEFIDLARRQVSSTMTAILLREEEVRRQRLVAEEASSQLRLWKAESKMHELRFTRLAETAPIGICTYAEDASLTYANDVYRHIFGMGPDDDVTSSDWWAHLVHPQDFEMAKIMFGRLLIQREAVDFEIRVKGNPDYKATPGPDGYVWVLVSAYAEPTGVGPQTVIACFTDINERKRAEDIQTRRFEEIVNAKRQQEAFIDMTSHEIRNPLSVVLHCSEEIISTCAEATIMTQEKPEPDSSMMSSILDAAETILFCTLHQKRIVDDILTLSKLESDLLPVTPDQVQPTVLIDGIMKLFEREIRKSDMKMIINIHPTFRECQLEQVLLDPSRVSQIVINLISNAIKFTKTQNNRRLDILLGGSIGDEYPSQDWPVSYIERQLPPRRDVFSKHWTPNESAHLHFSVQDTGAGMSEEEQQKIFSRFTQASPRTHVKYGGSGLGLYICRALSETHGGQIGCKSVSGQGSSFGFHIEVGRSPKRPGSLSVPNTSKPASLSRSTSSTRVSMLPESHRVFSSAPISGTTNLDENKNNRFSRFHVLVVEDNVLNQKVLRRQLEKAGHSVVVAHHGQHALDLLEKTTSWVNTKNGEPAFDFVLMDVEMPVMNGLECTQRIRDFEENGLLAGHLPIIATTGNARDEHTGQALTAGMDQVVLKPYSLSVLLPIAQALKDRYQRNGH